MSVVLTEQTRQSKALRVDHANARLVGAMLLGYESMNGRSYSASGIDPKIYVNRPVNIGHSRGGDRPLSDRLGWVTEAWKTPKGVFGTIQLLKAHPMTPTLLEIASVNPSLVGLSHTAKGDMDDNRVTLVRHVESCDVVCDPASTPGIFSEGRRPAAEPPSQRFPSASALRSGVAADRQEITESTAGRTRPARLVETVPSGGGGVGRWLAGSSSVPGAYRAKQRLEKLVERLSRNGDRRGRLLREAVAAEAGVFGNDAVASGALDRGGGDDEKDRRRKIARAVEDLLADESLPFDEALRQCIAILDDPDSLPDDGDDGVAEESRRRRPVMLPYDPRFTQAAIDGAFHKARKLEEQRRREQRVPQNADDPKALGRWLRGH